MEPESRHQYGLLWIGLGITVVGVASYLFSDPYQRSPSATHSQQQDDSLEEAKQQLTPQQLRSERNRFTNWLGIAAMTTGGMLWISSKRRISFSLLLATGLNLINSWHAIGIDDDINQTTETDNHVDHIDSELQSNEHTKLAETGLQYH